MSCVDVTLPPVSGSRSLLLVAAAALIDAEGKVLLTQRPPGKQMAGLWEFPGGKIDAHETPEMAVVRELKEELGIDTSVGCLWPLSFASHAYADFHLLMPLFTCRVWSGTPEAREGQRMEWVNAKEINKYDLVPADYVFVEPLRTL